jgi:hypothetical protein
MTTPSREPTGLDSASDGPSLLRLTPEGSLALCDAALGTLSAASPARRFAAAFERDARGALLSLAGVAYGGEGPLPAPLPWLRELATRFVTAVCATAELESLRDNARPALESTVRHALRADAPPFDGAEYLTESVVTSLWNDLGDALSDALSSHRGDVASWLRALDPRFHPVGRMCFHLAERRGDERAPFAFLATFTTGVGASGRAQHAPLGRAVTEAASARDGARLDALLEPVQRAAEQSAVVRELLESRELFQPLAWTAAEAHAFLRDAALCEGAGVSVRVPDWWQPARPTRPTVRVSVGDSGPARLGVDAMLSWSVDLCIDGEPLTEDEIAELMAGGAGLVRLRGRWVEADPARVEALLSRWREALSSARSGLSLHRALRMIAGAPLGDELGPSALDEDSAGWVRVEPGPWLAERLKGLREPASLGEKTDDASLRATLRPYQREGVAWLEFLTELGLGGVLADDMGLGKTLQVIAWITREKRRAAARRGKKREASAPHLLVVPASLLANWRDELARFAPELSVKTAHPSQSRDPVPADAAEIDRWRAGVDVVLTSYGAIARSDALRALDWSLVALDEAQAIKNPSTRQAQSVKSLRSTARLALTGTPVENRLSDLWSLFDFVQPGLLGAPKDFTRYARSLASSSRADAYAPLRALVGPYILRRMKTDRRVVSDLPDKVEVKVRCGLTKTQAKLYADAVESLTRALNEEREAMARRGSVLAALSRFKQVCNHPSQWTGDGAYDPAESGKFTRLGAILEEAWGRGEKLLVFTQFRELCEPLSAFARAVTGARGVVLHGATAVKSRAKVVESFQTDPAVGHFVLSLKAGGTGLNLTAAQHVVHFDRWWNPAVEEQATDRAYRIGQRRNVMVHKFVCRGTVEERIDALIEDKRALAASVVSDSPEDALRLTELNDEALLSLVALDLRTALDDD